MNAPFHSPDRVAMVAHTFDAIAEAASIAETYARAAAEMASIGDIRGVNYLLKSAGLAIINATEIAASMRPSNARGGA